MKVSQVEIAKDEALELYKKYKTHQNYSTPMDAEIRQAYQALSKGRLVIKARESIINAGVDEKGMPKLAIVRADLPEVFFYTSEFSQRFGFYANEKASWRYTSSPATSSLHFTFNRNEMPDLVKKTTRAKAIAPIIPQDLRPKRALQNYHILWEAEWNPIPPIDPYLLRRIGKSDLWVVLGMWDLTEVERAVLASRISVQ